jgi:hypothetical protein
VSAGGGSPPRRGLDALAGGSLLDAASRVTCGAVAAEDATGGVVVFESPGEGGGPPYFAPQLTIAVMAIAAATVVSVRVFLQNGQRVSFALRWRRQDSQGTSGMSRSSSHEGGPLGHGSRTISKRP